MLSCLTFFSSPELFELVKTYQVHILSELNLKRIFPTVCFVNPHLPEKGICIKKKELRELPDYSPKIFKKSNIDRYMERPSATFCNGKYSVLNKFCYTEILVYYALENKSNKTFEYHQDELVDNLVEK